MESYLRSLLPNLQVIHYAMQPILVELLLLTLAVILCGIGTILESGVEWWMRPTFKYLMLVWIICLSLWILTPP